MGETLLYDVVQVGYGPVSQVLALMLVRDGHRVAAELVRHTIYTFRSLVAEDWRRGRVLLAGDAAHTMPPFMGQGMCAGIRDAWNLRWKLDAVLRGEASDALLDSYTVERKPHVSAVIDAAVYLGRISCIADPAEAAARDRTFRDGTAEKPPLFPHLTAGLLAAGGAGLMAGLLAPHDEVEFRGRTGRWDDVVGLGFCVVLRDADPASVLRADQMTALTSLGAHVVGVAEGPMCGLVVDGAGRYTGFLETHGAIGMVTRPDFYIFGGVTEPEHLVVLVDELLGTLAANGMAVRIAQHA